MVRVEVPVLEDFQVHPVDIHLAVRPVAPEYQEVLVDNLADRENLVVIHLADQGHRAFQEGVQEVLNQVGSNPEDFHQAKDLLVDIQAGDPLFHFQAVNQQVVDILVAGLAAKDQVVFQVIKDQAEDIPVDRLLEVILVQDRSLVARELDILVEGQALVIQEVLRDLAVVQVLRDQADIQDQEDQAALKVLEVSKAQVEHLPAVTLVLDQVLKGQEVIQAGQVYKTHTENRASL